MSRADHPAGTARRCAFHGCPNPVAARVAWPQLPGADQAGHGFAIVRPATNPNAVGELVCVDCTHHLIDLMLMNAAPEPGRTP